MQAVEQEAMPLLAAHADEIRMNERLFGRIKAVYDRREALPLTAEQRRLTEKLYRRFVRSAPCWTRRASAGSKRSTATCRGCR